MKESGHGTFDRLEACKIQRSRTNIVIELKMDLRP